MSDNDNKECDQDREKVITMNYASSQIGETD